MGRQDAAIIAINVVCFVVLGWALYTCAQRFGVLFATLVVLPTLAWVLYPAIEFYWVRWRR